MQVPGASPFLMASAEFETGHEYYSVNITVIGNGSVDNTPGNPYEYNDIATLEPLPNPGWTFAGWSGPDASDLVDNGNATWSIVMDGDKNVTANYAEVTGNKNFLPLIIR